MELIFGIPSRRRKREEKYAGQAVLVIMPAPTEEGKTYRFELSLEAHKRLKLETGGSNRKVGISFKEKRLFIANVTGKGVTKSFSYTNNRSFSNKEMHIYICEQLGLDPTKEHILEINDFQESESANFIVAGEIVRPDGVSKDSKTEETQESVEDTTEESSEESGEATIEGIIEESSDTPVEAETTDEVEPEPEAESVEGSAS